MYSPEALAQDCPSPVKMPDFTKMIAEYSGQTTCDIQPCHSTEFPSLVKRPAYSVLDKTKIKTTFGLRIPYWTDSLKACMKNLSQNQ